MNELLRTAIDELRVRPLRTGLTLAGFAVSMAIATVLLAAGGGLERTVADVLRSLGEGQIVATPGRTTGVGGVQRSGREVRIRFKDVEAIRTALPSFEGVAAYFDLRGAGASSARYSIPWSPVRAVSAEYADVRRLPIVEGRWFTQAEAERGEWVTVLNQGLRRMIFRDDKAVDEWVEWRGRRMKVVGVVKDEALFPYILFVPYRTVSQNMADARWISGIVARPGADFDWERGERELRRALAGIGDFDPTDENAVEFETNEEFTQKVRRATLAFRILV
ncbi:MAG TPA: ABC transporter permease, partial [Planctomycetota bacterium]|nr:ABC transporter permease [Planctomycetota bacterium]